jgi:hypothetical protein
MVTAAAAALPTTTSDQDFIVRQSSKDPLTSEEYENCLLDQTLADTDMNSKLTKAEYLLFLSINAARYGYEWPYDKVTFQDSLEVNDPDVDFANLPLEFPMLFHSTACLCAYTQGTDSMCCTGDNEHVAIYNTANIFEKELTSEQMAYTTAFCTEALYTYSKVGLVAVPIPTSSPSIAPVVTTTMPTLVVTTTMPTIIPTIEVTTLTPTEVKETDSPTVSPTNQITTLLPTEEPTAAGEPTASPTIQITTLLPTEVEETSEPTTAPTVEVVETDSPTEAEFPTVSPTDEEAIECTPTESPTEEATAADTKSPTKLEFPTMSPTGPKEETNAPSASRGITMSPTVLAETGSPTQSPTVTLTTARPSIAVTEATTEGPLSIELQYDYNSECGVTADDIMNGLNDITLKEGLALATETIVIGVLNRTYPIAGGSTLAPIGKSTPAPSSAPVTAASGSTYRPTTNLEIPVTDDTTLIPSSLEGSGGGESTLAPDAGTSDSETGTTLAPTATVMSPALRSYTVMETSERAVKPYHLFPNNKNIHHRGLSNLRLGLRQQWLVHSSNNDERRQQSVTNAPTPTGLDIVTNVPTVAGSGGSEAVPTTDDSSTTSPTMGSSATVEEESSSSPTAIDGDSTTAPTTFSTPTVGSALSLAPTPSSSTVTITDVTGTILVYYTTDDPVIITAAEEYIDGCPSGFTCSKITSTVPLTLVSGNPEDVEVTVIDGFEASIDDASFFDAIPSDTVQCPEGASVVVTIAPSPAPFALLDPSGIVAPAVESSYLPTIEEGSMSMSMSGVTLTPSGIESTETQSPTTVGSSGTGTLAPSIGGTAVATTTPPVVTTARGIEIYSPTILTRTDDTDWTQNLENLHEKY